MADLARALQTPVPATQPAPQQTVVTADDQAREIVAQRNRDEKNKRDQQRRKEKRAADAKAAQLAADKKALRPKVLAKPKRKAKKKAAYRASDRAVMKQLPKLLDRKKKARGRGRPPGSKNKPKPGLSVALVPAPGVLPRAMPIETDAFGALNVAMNALYALPVAKRVDVLTMLNRLFG